MVKKLIGVKLGYGTYELAEQCVETSSVSASKFAACLRNKFFTPSCLCLTVFFNTHQIVELIITNNFCIEFRYLLFLRNHLAVDEGTAITVSLTIQH